MNRKFASFITSVWLLLCFAVTARGESTLDKIQRTGVLKVAIRQDAAPFGYLDANDNLQGYCLDFFTILEKQLLEKLNRNSLSVKLYKSTLNNRFELVSRGIVDLECGPNTIRSNISEVNFSTGFFQTGTQFLVKENNQIDLDGDLSNSRLGVIDNTTTAEFVAQRYPLATLQKYSGVTARTRGVEAVEQGKIDAMISDGILLRAEAQQQGLSSARYPLIPDVPLTCDRYGMIIPVEDPKWQNFVNSVINSSQIKALSTDWFGQLANYTQSAVDSCEKN